MNQDQIEHAALLRDAFNDYLVHVHDLPLNPGGRFLGYDFDFLNSHKWHAFAEAMIRCDLRELTNLINGWNSSLCRWHAWGMVLDGRDEREAWELRSEFLDSLAHECLLMPATIRDTIVSVATAAFHQVRLSIDRSYRDYLEGDSKTPYERSKHLNRKQKERQLSRIVQVWPESSRLLEALREINTRDYVEATYDYRNLTSHSIGPRLGIGHTRTVTRIVKQAQVLEEVAGGGLVLANVPGKVSVSYAYGGTPPLDIETVRVANLGQYEKARLCYIEFRALLEAAVGEIAHVKIPPNESS
ncbi:MAG: hypothetical protein M0Z56_10085 [Desulfobacteraceae bacterium]|nr:hypothetical protein [Desulfobacteraceae bacterium]